MEVVIMLVGALLFLAYKNKDKIKSKSGKKGGVKPSSVSVKMGRFELNEYYKNGKFKKRHYDAMFFQDGRLHYNIRSGAKTSYSVKGKTVSFVMPPESYPHKVTLHWEIVKKKGNQVLEFRGKSQGGAIMRAIKV